MSHQIPPCLGPRTTVSAPSWRPPAGCWDTQFHVLGPDSRHPYSPDRHYTPPAARLEDYFTLLDALGLERAFVVHANTQGPCNDIYLEAVGQAPERLLAVVRLDQTCTPETVRDLHRRGARGVRFAFNPQHGGRFDPSIVRHVLRCMRPWRWFVQLHFDGTRLPELEDWIAGLDAPVLIDHLGRVAIADGLDSAPQRALLRLSQQRHVWVKLSGLDRVCAPGASFDTAIPLMRRLAENALDRLTWGSDWPHTGYFAPTRMPDDGTLFETLIRAFPVEDRIAILRDNPGRLAGSSGART